MSIVRFREVAITARSNDKCPVCGRRTTRSKKFWQTISPFNRLPDGTPKTRDDINRELKAEADAWEPDHRHAACIESDGGAA
ncbi:hypothetical protein [Gordonia cholesterolivorans]|uniref:Uncharacterized protein n=1 Tax=Gordonia cholesterolivorans TaxID=559625 RepID=A0ABP5UEP4_9ACTN